jgi:hypothetical protein
MFNFIFSLVWNYLSRYFVNLKLKDLGSGRMSKNDKVDKDMEQGIWVKIPKKNATWKGVKIGDKLIGVYLKNLPDSFMGTPKTKYCIETDHPNAVDGKLIVYGTEGINNQLEDELIGCKIEITYKGTQPTKDPKKRPFKLCDIRVFLKPSHPKFKEYTEAAKDNEEPKSPGKAELADTDDSEAQNTIENYQDIYKSNNRGNEPKPQDIINMAESDPDLTDVELSRIKIQLARNIKKVAAA